MTRRRTCCVYCGERIAGMVMKVNTHDALRDMATRRAARLACAQHRRLVALDPRYSRL